MAPSSLTLRWARWFSCRETRERMSRSSWLTRRRDSSLMPRPSRYVAAPISALDHHGHFLICHILGPRVLIPSPTSCLVPVPSSRFMLPCERWDRKHPSSAGRIQHCIPYWPSHRSNVLLSPPNHSVPGVLDLGPLSKWPATPVCSCLSFPHDRQGERGDSTAILRTGLWRNEELVDTHYLHRQTTLFFFSFHGFACVFHSFILWEGVDFACIAPCHCIPVVNLSVWLVEEIQVELRACFCWTVFLGLYRLFNLCASHSFVAPLLGMQSIAWKQGNWTVV